MFVPYCWASMWVQGAGPCDGHLVKAHLIPKQLLKREGLPLWDDAVWVPMCGGISGIGGHHGMLDHSRTLRIPRDAIPSGLEAFAAEHDLSWWLEREYGPRDAADAA